MNPRVDRVSRRLPKRFPVGAKYVVEGRPGRHGALRLFDRYVVLPNGHRIDVPADFERTPAARAPARRRNRDTKPASAKTSNQRAGKKFAVGGTDCRGRH